MTLTLFLGSRLPVLAQSGDRNLAYIAQYKDLAIKEMQRVKIPASISLAQAILESAGGQSSMATEANNHFGIKCHNNWTGERYYMKDDDRDASGEIIQSCFRKYRDPYQSWMDHSDYLLSSQRYATLFTFDIYDYKRWAQGLKAAGYATAPTYAEMLVERIEKYQLYQYDYQAGGGFATNTPKPKPTARLQKLNGVPVIFASNGQSLNDIAISTGVKIADLRKYNERIMTAETTPLPDGYKVFVKRKKIGTASNKSFHTVQAGETMFSISQLYGIQLGWLYRHCRMKIGTQPAVGQKVALKFSLFGPPNKINTRSPSSADDAVIPAARPTTPPPPQNTTTNTPTSTTPTPNQQPGGIVRDANNDGVLDMDIIPGGVIDPNAPAPNIPRNNGNAPDTSTGNTGGNTSPTGTKPTVPNTPTPRPGQPGADTSVDPSTTPSGANTGTGTATPTPPNGNYYIVQKSDTLYSLSRKFGMTVDQLKKLNGITTDAISIGQQLRIK